MTDTVTRAQLLALSSASAFLNEIEVTPEMLESGFFPSDVIDADGYSYALAFNEHDLGLDILFYWKNQGKIKDLKTEGWSMSDVAINKANGYYRNVLQYYSLIQRWLGYPKEGWKSKIMMDVAQNLYSFQNRLLTIKASA